MKNKLFIKIIILVTVGILTACTDQNSDSITKSTIATEATASVTTTKNTTSMEITTTSTPVTELKSETELSLIELSKKSFNDYASDDYKFLLNTDRTSYIKAFNLKLDNGKAGVNSPDGWYRFTWSSVSSYILINVPVEQISIDIKPPSGFSPEEYLKPTTDVPYALSLQLNSDDMMFGKIKNGMTKEQVNEILEGSEIVCFTWEYSLDEGYFVKYEYDGLLYEFCFPENYDYRLTEIYISKI